MSVFYSHSTKNNQSYETYLKISYKLNNIIDVGQNPKNFSRLLDRITYHIKKADIFICDLTPDLPDYLYPNPNVMLELGYALEQFENNNIIYILNELDSMAKQIISSCDAYSNRLKSIKQLNDYLFENHNSLKNMLKDLNVDKFEKSGDKNYKFKIFNRKVASTFDNSVIFHGIKKTQSQIIRIPLSENSI
jgi:predicted ATP-grasp superfamily ATP-dependent carboligase